MTCKGYDPRAIKLPSMVKTMSTFILDKHKRGAFIKAHKECVENDMRIAKRHKKDKE